MQAVKGIVKNGRLVVNEPTELPEGEVVELWMGGISVSKSSIGDAAVIGRRP